MPNPIGQIKSKVTVYCSVCGQKHTRILKSDIFENTEAEIEKVKTDLTEKAEKEYTCRICKTIIKEVN